MSYPERSVESVFLLDRDAIPLLDSILHTGDRESRKELDEVADLRTRYIIATELVRAAKMQKRR